MENLTWDDEKEIAGKLFEKYPDMPAVLPSQERLLEMIISLEGFNDAPEPPHSIYLKSIRRNWIILWHGNGAEESLKTTRPDLSK